MGESPLSNAENVSSIPGQGTKIQNATGQLSPKGITGWKPVLALQGKVLSAATETPDSQINK